MNILTNGQRVQWQEGGAGQYTCTGTIICANNDTFGKNPLGWYTIKVDDEHYLRACHTASEMSSGWVCRSVALNKLTVVQL